MGNSIIAYGNRAADASLFGGNWSVNLPLTNLQDRRLGKLARSASAALADTRFDANLGGGRLLRVVALVNHNFSTNALYRVQLSSTADFSSTIADSGWLDVWPTVYPPGTLPWGSPSWWSGRYASDQIEGYVGTVVYILPASTNARYLRVEIDDTANTDGYVQIGRLFVGDAWQPVRNMIYGASLSWENRASVQEALSGAEYFDARSPVRVARFGLDALSGDEAMSRAFELQRAMGVDNEVLFVWDPDDTTHALRRQFLGRLRSLSAIENPGPDRWKTPFEIKELL